jgi:hypothetical protein
MCSVGTDAPNVAAEERGEAVDTVPAGRGRAG